MTFCIQEVNAEGSNIESFEATVRRAISSGTSWWRPTAPVERTARLT
jgi:hypothetical protein